MATWNFLIDTGIQEQVASMEQPAPYLQEIQNLTKPREQAESEIDLAGFGLQNMEEYQLMVDVKEQWWSWDDFRELLERSRQQEWPQWDKEQEKEIEEEVWFLETFREWTEDVIGGAISSVPSIIWNTFGFLADVITPKEFEWLWEHFRESWIKDTKWLQNLLWVNPESFATDVWEFWAEVWSLFIPWWQAKLATKFPQAVDKIQRLWTAINNIWQKAPKLFNVLKSSISGATDLAKFWIVSEWEVKQEDLLIWAIWWPVLTLWWKLGKWIIEKFWGARNVNEVAWNILQPTWKFGSLNFESAKQWLVQATKKLGNAEIKTIKDYKTLSNTIKSEKTKVFKPLTEWLNKIDKTYKDSSVTEALDWLLWVLKQQPSKKFKTITNEIQALSEKSVNKWLTLNEIQRVKQLHTQNNRLFTDTGKEAGWVSSEALREVRKDIKVLIEEKASAEWFKDVAKINTEYSNLLDAENLIQVQLWRLTNFLWREWKQSFLQNITEFALNLPWVKQWFKQPLETVFKNLWTSLKAWKIDPIRVEQQLPALLKELRASNIPEKAISSIMQNIVNTMKLLSWIWAKEILEINK